MGRCDFSKNRIYKKLDWSREKNKDDSSRY